MRVAITALIFMIGINKIKSSFMPDPEPHVLIMFIINYVFTNCRDKSFQPAWKHQSTPDGKRPDYCFEDTGA